MQTSKGLFVTTPNSDLPEFFLKVARPFLLQVPDLLCSQLKSQVLLEEQHLPLFAKPLVAMRF